MIRSAKFWIPMAVFQVVFGLTVFAVTRQYYISGSDGRGNDPAATARPIPAWPNPVTATDFIQLRSSSPGRPVITDPIEISRRADEFFANRQYDRAAELYAQLLNLDPRNVSTYNNLGITLHYLGRSTEALGKLNEGAALDPEHQRIRLTIGFVNNQLGNIEQARAALTIAAQIEADNEVGQSATRMLENLEKLTPTP